MGKRCKRNNCNNELQPSDGHVFCPECRQNKKGDDPCTRGKACKLCDILAKASQETVKKSQKSKDDALLDSKDGEEPQGSSKIEDLLATLSSDLKSMSSRLHTLESHTGSQAGKQTLHSRQSGANEPEGSDPQDFDLEVIKDEDDSEELGDTPNDPSYIEMLQAVKSVLDLEDPEIAMVTPPSAFKKKANFSNTKRQLSAFPPEKSILEMWGFRQMLASGKNQQGSNTCPLHTGQFLNFATINMAHYNTVPLQTTLKAQVLPESFHNLTRESTPGAVSTPWKQHEKQERTLREIVQVLERVVHFSRAVAELNTRVKGFCEDAKDPKTGSKEMIDMALTSNTMQARIIESIDSALESVLNNTMTAVCNLSLARRDTLLKQCKGLSPEDSLQLRNCSFTEPDLFPTEVVNTAEDNLLKRGSLRQQGGPAPKKQKFQYEGQSSSFRGQANYSRGGRANNQRSRGRSFRRGRGRSSFRQ